MPTEVWMWILTGFLGLLGTVFRVAYKLLREESKAQSDAIKLKADAERLKESEYRWNKEMTSLRVDNERLISKLEDRHQHERDAMEARLSSRMDKLESNVTQQMTIIIEMLKGIKK